MKNRTTWLLAGGLLLLFGAGYLVQQLLLPDTGDYAVLQVNGETVKRLKLSEDTQFLVGDREGAYNLVQIKEGQVSVTEANCPDEICVKTGAKQRPGEIIACLPHGLVISIEGQTPDTSALSD